MYNEYFGLNANPFNPTPPPDFIYHSRELKEALAHFRYALDNREAFLMLTGEVGTGKTTAIQALLRHLPPETPVAVVTHTTLEPRELIQEISMRFGMEGAEEPSKPVLLRRLEAFFEEQWRHSRQAILILDEAHLLSVPVLEEVRLLSNLEREGGKLVQICLVGQPELVGHLQQDALRQLRQRISVRYALRPLNEFETRQYLIHRLGAAGSPRPENVFLPEAVGELYRQTDGIPREINVVAGQAMLNAYLDGSPVVNSIHVESVRGDYGFEGLRPGTRAESAGGPPPPPPPKFAPGPPPPDPPRAASPAPRPPTRLSEAPSPLPKPIPLPPSHLRPEPRPVAAVPPVPPAPAPGQEAVRSPVPSTVRSPVELSSGRRVGVAGSSSPARGRRWLLVVVLMAVLAGVAYVSFQGIGSFPGIGRGDPPGEDPAAPGGVSPSPASSPAMTASGEARPEGNAGGESRGDRPATDPGQGDPGQGDSRSPAPPAARDSGRIIVSSSVGEGPVTAQIASFRSGEMADSALLRVTRRTGFSGVVVPPDTEDGWHRILLGGFDDVDAAAEALRPLLNDGTLQDIVILPLPPRWAGRLRGES